MSKLRKGVVTDPATGRPLPDGVSCRGPNQYQARKLVEGRRQTQTFKSAKAAAKWRGGIEAAVDRGEFHDMSEAKKWTIGEVIKSFAKVVVPTKHIDDRQEQSALRVIREQFSIAAIRMDRLAKKDIYGFIAELREADYAPTTIVIRFNMVARAIDYGMEHLGINIPVNPARAIKDKPKMGPHRQRMWEDGEEERALCVVDAEPDPWIGLLARWAQDTAMRLGECCAIDMEKDIRGRVCVVRGIWGNGSKNGEVREVPLFAPAMDVLQKARELPRLPGDKRLFPLDREWVSRKWPVLMERAKIEDFHFHDLRHEGCARNALRFPQAADLAKLTGHKDLNMLMVYYNVKQGEQLLRRAVDWLLPGETIAEGLRRLDLVPASSHSTALQETARALTEAL